MTRPPVTVVMPFGGDAAAALAAVQALLALETRPGDELILVDNAGVAQERGEVSVIRATAESSPAYARNAGAERASNDWILFLDADCRAPAGLLDRYLAEGVAADVGALAGEVLAAPNAQTLAGRYGAARSFLSQEAHLAHPYRPRAVAANLMVRRAAFETVGGFYEGLRAAEDTDFSWRLQQAGWRLEPRLQALVQHSYRSTLGDLRRQWRGYAAGRAWLARRYQGFEPEPAARRAIGRGRRRLAGDGDGAAQASRSKRGGTDLAVGRLERGRYFAVDALLAAEELRGLALSNRPPRAAASGPAKVVLVADRFPAPGDPLVEFAQTLDQARVEAVSRPNAVSVQVLRGLAIEYREDDGAAARAIASAKLVARHPLRCLADLIGRSPGEPTLTALAPAAVRLSREPAARLLPLGGEGTQATAERLAALTGRGRDGRERS